MSTPFAHIPGVRTSILDGALRTSRTSTQNRIILLGPASSGPTGELLSVFDATAIERKYGADSELMKKMHECLAQGADAIRVMRIGGTEGSLVIEDSAGETLTLTLTYRDDLVLDRYVLIIENDGSVNRFLVYDIDESSYVYDSTNALVLDTGIVEVVDTGIDLFTLNDKSDLTAAVSLADLITGDFTVDGTATISSVTKVNGTDGTANSLVEKYAALSAGYFSLDYKDGDIVIPTGVYIDDENIADDAAVATYGYYWLGVPVAETSADKLGYLWQYVHQGKLYTYFTDTSDYFSVAQVAATRTVNTDLVLTALKTGKGGNACTIQIVASGSGGPTVTINENTNGGLDVLVTDDGTHTTSAAVTAINLALAAFTTSTGVLASTLLQASGGAGTLLTTVAKIALASGAGGHVLTHQQLTGDTIPSAVSTKFSAGSDAQLRECNFAHQLATFCNLASINWKMMTGVISTSQPSAYSRSALSEYVGSLPTYTEADDYLYIDSPSDNGSGLLGLKLLAGKSKTSDGYRSALVEDGDSTDSYAYGGIILTTGASLPNGTAWPYGIDSSDEAVDGGGKPVDIGKHIWITATWLTHSNGYNGGSTYRGSIESLFAAKLAATPAYREPIGRSNGIVASVSGIPRIHAAQIDALTQLRYVTIRNEDGIGPIITSVRTAAHPDSDFVKASTIRCVNYVAALIRNRAHAFIGQPLDSQRLAALQADIDGALYAARQNGYHQGARALIKLTREEKIQGKFSIVLRMVPPFTTEQITLELSVAAEEGEL